MFLRGSIKYINYLLFSRHSHGHGIHSPFVFELVSGVFRNKIEPDIVLLIENIRKRYTSDKTIIQVNDLGSGSVITRKGTGRVCDIAKYSSVPVRYGILLSNLASVYGMPSVIEYGTAIGISTMYLASGRRDSVIYTMEGCLSLSSVAAENFRQAGFENITQMAGHFDESTKELKDKGVKPGLVFIDGNHRKEPLLKYFSEMADISDTNTVIVIDDIHLSREMEEAWDTIKQFDNVSFTIDLFRMGLVFFRKGISRFHYVIRY